MMAFMSSKKGTQAAVKGEKTHQKSDEAPPGTSEARTSLFRGNIRKEQST